MGHIQTENRRWGGQKNCTLSLPCAVSSNLPLTLVILISGPEGQTRACVERDHRVELLMKRRRRRRRRCWGVSDQATGSSSHLALWKQTPAKGHWWDCLKPYWDRDCGCMRTWSSPALAPAPAHCRVCWTLACTVKGVSTGTAGSVTEHGPLGENLQLQPYSFCALVSVIDSLIKPQNPKLKQQIKTQAVASLIYRCCTQTCLNPGVVILFPGCGLYLEMIMTMMKKMMMMMICKRISWFLQHYSLKSTCESYTNGPWCEQQTIMTVIPPGWFLSLRPNHFVNKKMPELLFCIQCLKYILLLASKIKVKLTVPALPLLTVPFQKITMEMFIISANWSFFQKSSYDFWCCDLGERTTNSVFSCLVLVFVQTHNLRSSDSLIRVLARSAEAGHVLI